MKIFNNKKEDLAYAFVGWDFDADYIIHNGEKETYK